MDKPYEVIDHTADISVKVSGKTLSELLMNSALAMMDIICDLGSVKPLRGFKFSATGSSYEQLIVNLLQEILYMHEVNGLVFCRFEININEKNEAEVTCWGEETDFSRHDLLNDIKAVTYSGLKVENINGEISATITFDI